VNFLEQLVAEWYQYLGYLVRSNIVFGWGRTGGYEGEIDVVALHRQSAEFLHIETSGAACSWREHRGTFARKFQNAAQHYDELFPFETPPVQKVAIFEFSDRPRATPNFGDIEVVSVKNFIWNICQRLRGQSPKNHIYTSKFWLTSGDSIRASLWRRELIEQNKHKET